jgi:gamma-glutamylcyclotransferase (GGCT)/AIG2-like uncharacterized protein YtfP
MQIQPDLVFVYGTLKESRRLRSMLRDVSRWRVLGPGTIAGRLYDAGPYPVLAMSDNPNDRVPGLLVKLESGDAALARLDDYEDVSHGLYERRRVPVQLDESTTDEAWVYVYRRSVEGFHRIEQW